MKKVCYVEEFREGLAAAPGWLLWEVTKDGPHPRRSWLPRKTAAQWGIVYRDSCVLIFNNLEVVSFVHAHLATGYVCSCDLTLRILNPELLVVHLGTDEGVVTEQDLDEWVRPRLAEILKDAGESRNLESKVGWPELSQEISKRLPLPRGSSLQTFSLREVQPFEKRLEQVRLIEDFRTALDRAIHDGRIAQAMAGHRVDEFLNEIGEKRAASLLSRSERKQPARRRLERYMEMFGLKFSKAVDQLTELQRRSNEIQQTSVETQRQIVRILERLVPNAVPASGPPASGDAPVAGESELAGVLDELHELQLKELGETLDELERLQKAESGG